MCFVRVIFLILLICAANPLRSQNIFISEPQKISTELIGYDILGKTKNGDVLVYKKYRFQDEIDVFDKQMNLKRHKDITIKNMDYESVEVMKAVDNIYHFYMYKDNKINYLSVQLYNSDIEKKGDAKIIDSTSLRLGENFSEFKIIKARSNPFFLIYKHEFNNGKVDKLYCYTVNVEGNVVQSNLIDLPGDNFDPYFVKAIVTDDGKPVFLFENEMFSCKKEKTETQYAFYFPQQGNNFISNELASNEYCFDEINFDVDNISGNIIAVSFLKTDNKDYMVGYNYLTLDVASGGAVTSFNYIFPQETLDEIAGMTIEKSIKNLPVFQIGAVVPRMDGGALLVAEYYDKTVENYEYTNYDPYYGYRTSTRQVEFYEYDDILLFSIKPDGTPTWDNVIRKKQISREDRGINSSYALLNSRQKLYFIFNENVEQNSNVLQYEMEADGTLDRKSLFNASQQEVQLRPASAKQISFNEIIIPSIYKKSLAFVKLSF